ncbi:hypothetical protein RI367_002243 [Sorochytrium milnesiophthora]
MSANAMLNLPFFVLTDSYKLSHYAMYPDANKMVAYGEFRSPYDHDADDHRIVFYGMRYIVEQYIARQWTQADLVLAEQFFATHNAGRTPFPFPRDLFQRFITENDGFFPVKIEALPEGSVVYPHVPVYQVTAEGEYARLVTFLETLLTMVWYPTTVATLSRRCKQALSEAFDKTVDDTPECRALLDSRLHDFGFRGCTSVEQSVIGGVAHLLNFDGTDTMSAAYYAQFHLNQGRPVGSSIPASEHSVMTSWPSERQAMLNMIEEFGSGVFACVMDSYDYMKALSEVLPTVAQAKLAKGGFLVLRPDSGDQVDVVLAALEAADRLFGSAVNAKGCKVPNGVGVIQGDGVTYASLQAILAAVEKRGFSAQSVAFGMGGGLLQKVNRDTMSFATKLSFIEYKDGTQREVMKYPKTDSGKVSLPGVLDVHRNEQGLPVVTARSEQSTGSSLWQTVYDGRDPARRHFHWATFDKVRERVDREWKNSARVWDPVSPALHEKCSKIAHHETERLAQQSS